MDTKLKKIKVEQFNPNINCENLLDKALGSEFIVIQVPLADYIPFLDFIHDRKSFDLSLLQNLRLAEHFNIPIRVLVYSDNS